MARINIYTLQEENQFLCNISLRLIIPCFSMVMDCIIIQGLTTTLYCPGGRYAIIHSGSLFTLFYMVMGCNIIQEVKGLMKKLNFVLLSVRKTSFYAKFQLIVHIVYLFLCGCGLHYNGL